VGLKWGRKRGNMRQDFTDTLEQLGEDDVRRRLQNGALGDPGSRREVVAS